MSAPQLFPAEISGLSLSPQELESKTAITIAKNSKKMTIETEDGSVLTLPLNVFGE